MWINRPTKPLNVQSRADLVGDLAGGLSSDSFLAKNTRGANFTNQTRELDYARKQA
jgi:hypothetical protein